MNGTARAIAFYLPQFHPIPENNEWWGKGFTEWTNTARAKPLFRGHYQPHVPADLGFYDLRCPESRADQAELAREYGIEGFCYYHYWFGGRRILERPFQDVLDSGEPDFPFCLCWANHSWNSIWQGCPDDVLIEQIYPGWDDHAAHFDYLLHVFSDPRYITVDGKPLFLVYNADEIPDVHQVTDYWRKRAQEAGLAGLYLVAVSYCDMRWNPEQRGFDASTWQPLPAKTGRIPWRYPLLKLKMLLSARGSKLSIFDYSEVMGSLLRTQPAQFVDHPTVLPNWDNTPRSKMNGLVLHDSTPELFRTLLRRAIGMTADLPKQRRLIFIKAWNEWAEGNHLEPDQRFGRGYLDVVREEILNLETAADR